MSEILQVAEGKAFAFSSFITVLALTSPDLAREVIDAIVAKGNHSLVVCSRKVSKPVFSACINC